MRYGKGLVRLLLLRLLVSTAQGDNDPLKDFCRRFAHRTTVLNNKIYVDGGYVNWPPLSAESPNITNNWLLYGDILTDNQGFPQFFETPTKQSPSLAGGSLWADEVNQRFYAFGGYFPSETPKPFETWTYDDKQSAWSTVFTRGDPMTYVAHGMSAVAPDAGLGYYLGGYQDEKTQNGWPGSRQYMSQLATFNMITREYSNHSGPDQLGRGEGFMTFMPASFAGVLVYFGGVVQDPSRGNISGASMEDIWVFDIDLQKWYMQKATGDIPEDRARFCGGVAWVDDKSSYNIYILGGIDPEFETAGFGDLYILTMPAFVWVKMWPRPEDGNNATFPHHSMTCDIINGTQMISMGGYFPTLTTHCDVPAVYGQHGLDLGQINDFKAIWSLLNHNNPPYRVPPLLVNIIGGTNQGGANVTAPKGNITYDKYLFEKAYKVPQRYPTPIGQVSTTPGTLAPTSTTQPGVRDAAPSTSHSVLIGSVVGSIIGGICVGIAGFYLISFLRRRNSRSKSVDAGMTEQSADGKGAEKMDDEPFSELVTSERPGELWADPVELPVGRPGSPARG